MRKASVRVLMAVLALFLCFGLVACNGTDDSGGTTQSTTRPNEGGPSASKPFEIDLAGYVANIGNATALGISKKASSGASTASYVGNTYGIQQLSCVASVADVENKSYIVMSTTEYDANAPEADKNGLTAVTFTKIITENVTTETTGTRYAVANEGTVSISAVEGFKYTVYYNDSVVYSEVQDNGPRDKDAKIGVILLDNLSDGVEYKIEYKGIGIETTMTQDQIDGEIDKLCVVNGYTFISYVPLGQSRRPADASLEYDYDGVAIYDKNDYRSSNVRQSFVIDNATGYVYPLEDFPVDTIRDGLVISSDKYYDMSVSDNGELNFVQLVRNETLTVYNAFKDKYGNRYVQNDYLDAYDAENRTVYYTKLNYILSQEGIAIHMEYSGLFSYCEFPNTFQKIEKMDASFTPVPISEEERFTFHYTPLNHNSTYLTSSIVISHIEDGYLYVYATQESCYTYYLRVHVFLPFVPESVPESGMPTETELYSERRSYGVWGHDGGGWEFGCLKSAPIDYNTVLIWSDWSGTPKLYYGSVWGENGYQHYGYYIDETNLTILLENCTCDPVWSFDLDVLRFRYTTFTETIFYKVIVDENGLPQIVNSKTYIAPEQEVVTLQPINK